MDRQTKVLSTIFFCVIFVCFASAQYSCTSGNGASVYYADNCYSPSQKVDLVLEAPVSTSQASTNTLFQTTGNTLVRFVNLKSGVTYYFSTCDETSSTPGKSKFDTILILRDPSGNVIASNDDCTYSATSLTCSGISYSHSSNIYNQASLLVIYKKIDPSDGDYICGVQSSSFRSLTTVASWASSSAGCSFDLICDDIRVYTNYGNSVTYTSFVDSSSDLCGGTPAVYINGAQKSTYDCSDIGLGTATISLYGETCSVELYVYPKSIPQPTVCADNTNQGMGYKATLVYPTPFDSNVEFMSENPLFTMEYGPYLDIYQVACLDSSDYLFDMVPDERVATFGDVVSYYVQPFTPLGQPFDSAVCDVFFAGVQPIRLISLDDPNSNLILDEGTIYFNTPYRFDYVAALPDLSVNIAVHLYNGTGNLLNPSFYYIPAVTTNNNCGSGTFATCVSYSTFCIPSDSGIEDGYYQILFSFDSNYLNPIGCGIPNYVVVDPSIQQGQFISVGKKRNIGVPSKMISLGNPTVLITSNPDPDRVLTCYP